MASEKIMHDKSALFVRSCCSLLTEKKHRGRRFLAAFRLFIVLASSEHQLHTKLGIINFIFGTVSLFKSPAHVLRKKKRKTKTELNLLL